MSLSKDKLEKFERRGFGDVPEKFVCQDCVSNEDWKLGIKRNARHAKQCSYGDERRKCASLEDFISQCMDFIKKNYDRVWEDWGIKPDEETGEYSMETWDTVDLIHNVLATEAGIVHDELLNDIDKAIKKEQDVIWCKHNPFD